MKKIFVIPLLLVTIGLCSFQKPTVTKGMPRVGRKQARHAWLNTMKMYAEQGDYTHLGHIGKAAIEDDVSLNQMMQVAEKTGVEPFIRAIKATHNIRELSSSLPIPKSEIFRISLFIEAELPHHLHSHGKTYLSRRNTGLERTLEYDPETQLIFIHLKDRGVKELGHGEKKVVTKSILYDADHPKLVARCSSTTKMEKEMRALKLMQGANGIVELHACTERKLKDGQSIYNMMCQLYEGGTLSKAFTDKYPFSFKQKLYIARDLIEGLDAMHAKGLVHRDLSARNVLLDYPKKGKRKERVIHAAIADFGRCRHIDETASVRAQFNDRYLAPEAIINERLEGEDYFATDLYALGCILHRLFYEKSGPWIDVGNLNNPTQPEAVKEAKLEYELKRYREMRMAKLVLKGGTGPNASTRDRFEQIILDLIHHDPSSRGSAQLHAQAINEIIHNHENKLAAISSPDAPFIEAFEGEHQEEESSSTATSSTASVSVTEEVVEDQEKLESEPKKPTVHVPTVHELLQGKKP